MNIKKGNKIPFFEKTCYNMKITCKGVKMNDLEKIEFYKKRNEEKSVALDKILIACLEATNQENIFDIADDALKYL